MTGMSLIAYVIDDDESVRKAFSRLLRSEHIEAKTFSSAEEFLKSDIRTEGACIIADLRMPSITGVDLRAGMAAAGISIPIIVVSTLDTPETRAEAKRLGASAFFRKPVDDQALLDAIRWIV